MNATLQDARALFPNVAADTRAMSAEELLDAIRTKDGAKFDAASEKFTSDSHKERSQSHGDLQVLCRPELF